MDYVHVFLRPDSKPVLLIDDGDTAAATVVARLGASRAPDIDATTLPLYSEHELALRAG